VRPVRPHARAPRTVPADRLLAGSQDRFRCERTGVPPRVRAGYRPGVARMIPDTKKPGAVCLSGTGRADSMTAAKKPQVSGYRTSACRLAGQRSSPDGANRGEGLATAGGTVNPAHNVRGAARRPTHKMDHFAYGAGPRGRVDPYGDVRAYTAGPTSPAQSRCVEMAPAGTGPRSVRVTDVGRSTYPRARRGRGASTSRPGAAVMGRAAYQRPTDRPSKCPKRPRPDRPITAMIIGRGGALPALTPIEMSPDGR
jgi:hypothetical protein